MRHQDTAEIGALQGLQAQRPGRIWADAEPSRRLPWWPLQVIDWDDPANSGRAM